MLIISTEVHVGVTARHPHKDILTVVYKSKVLRYKNLPRMMNFIESLINAFRATHSKPLVAYAVRTHIDSRAYSTEEVYPE